MKVFVAVAGWICVCVIVGNLSRALIGAPNSSIAMLAGLWYAFGAGAVLMPRLISALGREDAR